MDRLFPAPELDDRFDLVVQAITGTVAEHGYAEMRNVPGDQQAALRRQVRSAVNKRSGHATQTLARGSLIVFVCEPIHQQHAAERERAIAQATSSVPHRTAGPAPADALAPVVGYMGGQMMGHMRRCPACRPRRGEDGE